MKYRILILFLLITLLAAGCGLDTSGIAGPPVTLDWPVNNSRVALGTSFAIMAHASRSFSQMFAVINGLPVVELSITQPSDDLWEGTGYWPPVVIGRYTVCISVSRSGSPCSSNQVTVYVLEAGSFPMLAGTPSPAPSLPSIIFPSATAFPSATSWPAAQVSYWADALSLLRGGCTLLHWDVAYATAVYLNGEFVAQQGSRQVCPSETTTYLLHAEAPAGAVDQQITIAVSTPIVTISPIPPIQPISPLPPQQPPVVPADTTGPSITSLSHSPDLIFDGATCGSTSATINVRVSDPSGVSDVSAYYRVVRGKQQGTWRSIPMSHSGGNNYQTALGPAELQASLKGYGGGTVEYYVRARDQRGNSSQSPTRQFEVKVCLI